MQKLPQLTLRDLFWIVALVAMGCGWWVEHREKQEFKSMIEIWMDRAEGLREELKRRGTEIRYDEEGGMTTVTGSWTDGS